MLKNFNIRSLLNTATIRHSILTTIFTGFNAILGALFFILVARNLGPDNFGIVSVSIAFLTLVSDFSDFGIDTGLINFISKNIHIDTQKAYQYMKLGLISKVVISILVIVVGFLLAPFIADKVFLKPELTVFLQLSLIGVLGLQLFSFVTHSLQALQKYTSFGIVNIASNLSRLIILGILILTLKINAFDTLTLYIVMPFFAFFLGLLLLPNKFLAVNQLSEVSHSFFHYNKWVGLTIFVTSFSSRVDTFMITRLLDISAVGIYAVALQLTSVIPQFTFAIASVVAPKIASFDSHLKLKSYLKKLQLLVIGLSILGVIGMLIGVFLIPVIYGSEYAGAVIPFIFLFISQLVFLLSIPWHQSIYYYFSKPHFFAYLAFIQLILSLILTFVLINKFYITGAAIASLIINLIGFIVPLIWVLLRLRNESSVKKSS